MRMGSIIVLGILLISCVPVNGSGMAQWEIGILDLQTAQEIALADNPSLMASAERVEQARQRVEQARALYYPSVDVEGSAAWSYLSESAAFGQSRQGQLEVDRNQERYRLALVGSWVIFDGYARKFTNLAAQHSNRESEEARRDGQRLLLQLVADNYYNAHLHLYNQKIAKANMEFNSQQLKEARIRYEQGAGSLSNMLNFKVQINRAKTELLVAERDYETTLYGLAVLLGIEDARFPEEMKLAELLMIEKDEFLEPESEELISAALTYRPDLLQKEIRVEKGEAEVGRARAPYYPIVRLRGSLDGDSTKDIYLEEEDFGATVALGLSYNLYRGGGDEARITEAQALKRQVSREYQEQKNRVVKEVLQAYSNLQLAQEQLLLQRSSTDLVTQTRDLVREGYKAGQESLVRLNEAQRDLVRTQSNLALALVGLYRFRHDLITVTGESLLPFEKEQ